MSQIGAVLVNSRPEITSRMSMVLLIPVKYNFVQAKICSTLRIKQSRTVFCRFRFMGYWNLGKITQPFGKIVCQPRAQFYCAGEITVHQWVKDRAAWTDRQY
jgi:hypothetical protein